MAATVGLALYAAASLWVFAESTEDRLDRARAWLLHGTARELALADRELSRTLAADALMSPDQRACLMGSQALIRGQLWVEFGVMPADTTAAPSTVDAPPRCRDAVVAEGLVALARGELAAVESASARAGALPEPSPDEVTRRDSLAPHHRAWFEALRVLASGDATPEAIDASRRALEQAITAEPEAIAYQRALARLEHRAGEGTRALRTLRAARAKAPDHMGLAADEALLNAAMLREFSGVADLADQLLELDDGTLFPHDRARAQVARATVHVYMGEPGRGLAAFDEAWDELSPWDWSARWLALDTALTAGDSARAREWWTRLEDEGRPLPAPQRELYDAWALLAEGDLMGSLSRLAELPQQPPRVAYLQALALVEQRRYEEAQPWLARARELLPGRAELEVASARASIAAGELDQALRKLEGLAEEEPFAPRAWTGLGEAYLAKATRSSATGELRRDPARDDPELLRKAHTALLRAVEQEPIPAEAMVRLSELWQRQRLSDPDGDRKALDWLERAAKTNPKVPRYSETLALYLVGLGQGRRAEPMLRELITNIGSTHRAALALAELSIARAREQGPGATLPSELDTWLEQARERGAAPEDLARARAHAALVTGRRRALLTAAEPLKATVESSPDDIDARVLYARLLMKLRDNDEAEKIIRRGIHRGPEGRTGRLYYVWATLEVSAGSPKMASIHARIAYNRMRDEQRPTGELIDAVDLCSSLYIRKEMGDHALAVTRELSRRVPSHPDAWRLRARAELALNDARAARRSIEKSLELDPDNPAAHALHAQILLRYGKRKPARAAYRRALELDPGETLRAKVERGLSRM
ncbi:MAG: tetratricopeptide repeat protein [Myxococcales bacterium]|nr:tetratricopeptide repeat protein [Myxococcales bacterium]